jgi:hypothetical protein
MYNVAKFTMRDMTECGNELRKFGAGAKSMEESATRIVNFLYENLGTESNEKAFALIRLFKTHTYEELDPGLQAFSDAVLGQKPEAPGMKCLTLLATAGDQTAWTARADSEGHKAIPLPSAQVVEQFPMVSQLVKQFGLEVHSVLDPDLKILMDLEQTTFNVFYIPEAAGSPYITAQEEFVIPYQIKSVLGFGGMLPSGNLFAIIMFSKVPIPQETADMFKTIALNVKMALLPFAESATFS